MAAVICDLIGDICRPICSGVAFGCREVSKSPFLPYLALTFALNTPGVVYALKSLESSCGDLKSWLLPNAIFCLLHMIAAYYVVSKIREPSSLPTTVNENSPLQNATTGFSLMPNGDIQGEENSFQRIKHILLYDKNMAVYILVFVIWLVWLPLGLKRRLENSSCDDITHYVDVSIACGYTFFSLVGVAFTCSLCCLKTA
ncbi:unnamed protein product [Cylindrotheca closterium]|uniref:Uncharacterized protein n=1 Tax=Cylindrotheca closterium TaxID=2856 RepID=A0AAD2CFI4_9STRA|nr:unnamed protein product [Cylindrotheca closterium]